MTDAAKPRSLWLLSVFALTGIVILCWLGAWQLQRRTEKADFIQRLATQKDAAFVDLPSADKWQQLDLAAADLRRVSVTGTWLPQSSATVRVAMPDAKPGAKPGERKLGGFGRYMITAMRLDNGSVVLINRGFAPEASVASIPAPTGRAEITGILRKPEAPNSFTPPANVATRDFHIRDPQTIAAALGLSAAPFMVEQERGRDASTPPVGVDITELIERIPNNHLQYAFTWFGLAATLAGVFIAFVRGGRRNI